MVFFLWCSLLDHTNNSVNNAFESIKCRDKWKFSLICNFLSNSAKALKCLKKHFVSILFHMTSSLSTTFSRPRKQLLIFHLRSVDQLHRKQKRHCASDAHQCTEFQLVLPRSWKSLLISANGMCIQRQHPEQQSQNICRSFRKCVRLTTAAK